MSDERWRIDFEYGSYISLAIEEEEKAWALYRESGIRIMRCKDIFDEGVVVEGKPIISDLTQAFGLN